MVDRREDEVRQAAEAGGQAIIAECDEICALRDVGCNRVELRSALSPGPSSRI
jgi:hypothetical protein